MKNDLKNERLFEREAAIEEPDGGAADGIAVGGKRKWGVKTWITYGIFVLICLGSVALTAFLDFGTDKESAPFSVVAQTLADNFIYIIYALICFVLVLVFKGVKRTILLNACLKRRNNFFLGLKTSINCKYYDSITPAGSGGQPMEILYLRKHGIPTSVASGVSITSYAIGLISSVLLGVVMMMVLGFDGVDPIVSTLAIIGVVINIALPLSIVVFSAMPKVGSAIARWLIGVGAKLRLVKDRAAAEEKAVGTMVQYATSIRFFFGTYLFKTLMASVFAFAYNIALYSIPYFIIRAFGVAAADISYFKVLERCLICYLAVTAVPTPGNSGAAEISFYAIFQSFLGGGYLFWSVIVWRFSTYYLFIIVGFVMSMLSKIFHGNGRRELASVAVDADSLAKNEAKRRLFHGEEKPPEIFESGENSGDEKNEKNADNGVIAGDLPPE